VNRNAKGAIAAGAAVVVLLGGAGSYALWSDEGTNTPGSVTSGELTLTSSGAGTWTDISATGINGTTSVSPASDLLVPLDTWRYTTTYTATATGKNMDAVVTVVNPGTAGALPEGVTVTPTATVGTTTSTGSAITIPADGLPHTVTVNVTVAFADVDGDISEGETVDVSDMSVSLNQVRS